jgi:flagellar assembly protein FliH
MTSTAARPAKFLFDTRLDAPEAPPPVPLAEVEALKAQHEAALQAARREAEASGREAGKREALAGIENDLATKLDQLQRRHAELQRRIDERLQAIEVASLRLALTAAERLAAGLITREPVDAVENFVKGCLSLLPTEGRLMLHVAPGLAGELAPRINALVARSGRLNLPEVIADSEVDGADCRIVWPDGGIERDRGRILAEIERVFAAHFGDTTDNHPTDDGGSTA